MSTVLAIIALVVSIGSLGFGIYQYRILDRIRLREKANNLLRTVHTMQRRSEELRHKIGCTDDAPDCDQLHAKINGAADAISALITSTKSMSWKELNDLEARVLSCEQEIDLLYKQVAEFARFNEEVHEYEKSQRKA
jgi:FtsZ-binding cell division protein ZapB